jgi:hypothetical protein
VVRIRGVERLVDDDAVAVAVVVDVLAIAARLAVDLPGGERAPLLVRLEAGRAQEQDAARIEPGRRQQAYARAPHLRVDELGIGRRRGRHQQRKRQREASPA